MATNALNRLEPSYYIINITAAVDNESPELFSGGFPATLAQSLDIERTNMRYVAVVRGLSTDIQPLQTSSIQVTGRTATAPATAIQFTVPYDRPEFLSTEDEDNPGTFLTGVDALQRYTARALIQDEVLNRQIFDPESIANEPQIIKITATKAFATLAEAETNITVIEVADLID